jgi:hypothetical protein
VDLIFNDLSLAGQFPDVQTFADSMGRIMQMRTIAARFGRELRCHRSLLGARVTHGMSIQQAVQALRSDERRALMQWFTRIGPFWDDCRQHTPDDYIECSGDVVTDTAVGEAAWCCLHSMDIRLVSMVPSRWGSTPIMAQWFWSATGRDRVAITNYWACQPLEVDLSAAPMPIGSWQRLRDVAVARYVSLTFGPEAFDPLEGHPFVVGAAHRLLFLLSVLDRLKRSFHPGGERTAEGHAIFQDFFTGRAGDGGRGALFSDSSDREKTDFRSELTFPHPLRPSEALFCPFHGKVQTPQLRIHFSAPIRADAPLCVVYVGPKITKR